MAAPASGRLGALLDEVLREVVDVLVVLVEMVRGGHDREHRHVGVELYAHQPVDHRGGHEIVAVDAAVDHESGRDDRPVTPGERQTLCGERNLEGAGNLEELEGRGVETVGADLLGESLAGLVDDVAMPGGLHERDLVAASDM